MEELCRQVAAAAVARVSPPGRWFVDITLTGDEDMLFLNRRHRGREETTDVLSFPQFSRRELEQGAVTMGGARGEPMPLGDVVINVDAARRSASQYGHSLRRELGFLTAHGTLHLLGYTHDGPDDEAVMMKLTEEILAPLHLER